MLKQFTDWLQEQIEQWWQDAWEFVLDIVLEVLEMVLGGIVALLGAIPVPAFMAAGMQSLFSNLDPSILYFVGQLQLPAIFAMIGVAYLVRLARIFVTLFQWS